MPKHKNYDKTVIKTSADDVFVVERFDLGCAWDCELCQNKVEYIVRGEDRENLPFSSGYCQNCLAEMEAAAAEIGDVFTSALELAA